LTQVFERCGSILYAYTYIVKKSNIQDFISKIKNFFRRILEGCDSDAQEV
jgi:uncharacterized protein YlzI (FlbEa/FlbD family)